MGWLLVTFIFVIILFGFTFNILQVGITATSQNQQYLNDKVELGKHTIKFN